MRVMVTFAHRFQRTPDGRIYTRGTVDYKFLSRYLKVFDEVVVLARIEDVTVPPERNYADGPGVSFFALPYYYGPIQYAKKIFEVERRIKQAPDAADAFILRVAGFEGTLLEKYLRKRGIPYGIEVVADPWDVLAPGSVKTKLRPYLRWKARRDLVRQCKEACASSYVTEYSLQKRYPPGGWTTHYSTIDLKPESIADDSVFAQRTNRIKVKLENGLPLCLCCTGQMSQLYKAQDILISAFARCVKKGINLELWLMGDGSFRPQLEKQAEELGVRDKVTFWGNVRAGKDVFEKLDGADIFVLPSRQEGLPRAMIEAMARGLPCIGSTVGGFVELIGPDYIVEPDNIDKLAAMIETVSGDVDGLKRLCERNLKKACEYRIDILEQRRREFYQKIADTALEYTMKTKKWKY